MVSTGISTFELDSGVFVSTITTSSAGFLGVGVAGGCCSTTDDGVTSAPGTATVGEAATGFAGSFGLGETTAPGAGSSSVFDGVAALMGLLLFRGVCLVRGDEILGERAGFDVLLRELELAMGESEVSMEMGLVLLAGGV